MHIVSYKELLLVVGLCVIAGRPILLLFNDERAPCGLGAL